MVAAAEKLQEREEQKNHPEPELVEGDLVLLRRFQVTKHNGMK